MWKLGINERERYVERKTNFIGQLSPKEAVCRELGDDERLDVGDSTTQVHLHGLNALTHNNNKQHVIEHFSRTCKQNILSEDVPCTPKTS